MKDKQQKYLLEHYNNPDTYYAAAFGFAAFLYCPVSSNTIITKYMPFEVRPDVDHLVIFSRKPNEKKRQWGEIKHAEIRKHKNGIYKYN